MIGSKVIGKWAAFWALVGFSGLIGSAVWRLSHRVYEVDWPSLTAAQWAFGTVFWVFMLISEGYGGFQKKLSPRFASRALFLVDHPSWTRVLFAPFFCVGYFQAPKRRVIASYTLTLMIILLVMLVRHLEQPWRGLVDLGVISGLIYGVGTLVVHFVGVLVLGWKPEDPELAGGASIKLPDSPLPKNLT